MAGASLQGRSQCERRARCGRRVPVGANCMCTRHARRNAHNACGSVCCVCVCVCAATICVPIQPRRISARAWIIGARPTSTVIIVIALTPRKPRAPSTYPPTAPSSRSVSLHMSCSRAGLCVRLCSCARERACARIDHAIFMLAQMCLKSTASPGCTMDGSESEVSERAGRVAACSRATARHGTARMQILRGVGRWGHRHGAESRMEWNGRFRIKGCERAAAPQHITQQQQRRETVPKGSKERRAQRIEGQPQ
jgi:hypothetical protein